MRSAAAVIAATWFTVPLARRPEPPMCAAALARPEQQHQRKNDINCGPDCGHLAVPAPPSSDASDEGADSKPDAGQEKDSSNSNIGDQD